MITHVLYTPVTGHCSGKQAARYSVPDSAIAQVSLLSNTHIFYFLCLVYSCFCFKMQLQSHLVKHPLISRQNQSVPLLCILSILLGLYTLGCFRIGQSLYCSCWFTLLSQEWTMCFLGAIQRCAQGLVEHWICSWSQCIFIE